MNNKKKSKIPKILLIFVPIIIVLGFYYYYYNIYMQGNIDDIFKVTEPRDETKEKLKEIGYSDGEVAIIKKLSDINISIIKTLEYNEQLIEILEERYFIEDKILDYLDYKDNNEEKDIREIVERVNTNRHYDFYTNIEETDLSKGILIISNKYYKLPENFEPDNLTNLEPYYGIGSLAGVAHDAFLKMHSAASDENLRLYATSTYRDYSHQERLYTNYAASRGKEEADTFSARAGHSEHQTGLALDFIEPGSTLRDFGNTNEFEWLAENAHKYGFILRYPEDKVDITGYIYEPWHYRYVGVEVATYIFENEITFDEYYAVYVK